MKKALFIIVALFLSMTAYAQKAEIKFDNTTVDLGKFGPEDVIKQCNFTFKNTGDANLYIHQVIPSCGCTSESFPKHAIKPGESGTIVLTYNGTKKGARKFRTSILVHSNAKHEMTKIYIKGEQLPRPIHEVEEITIEE